MPAIFTQQNVFGQLTLSLSDEGEFEAYQMDRACKRHPIPTWDIQGYDERLIYSPEIFMAFLSNAVANAKQRHDGSFSINLYQRGLGGGWTELIVTGALALGGMAVSAASGGALAPLLIGAAASGAGFSGVAQAVAHPEQTLADREMITKMAIGAGTGVLCSGAAAAATQAVRYAGEAYTAAGLLARTAEVVDKVDDGAVLASEIIKQTGERWASSFGARVVSSAASGATNGAIKVVSTETEKPVTGLSAVKQIATGAVTGVVGSVISEATRGVTEHFAGVKELKDASAAVRLGHGAVSGAVGGATTRLVRNELEGKALTEGVVQEAASGAISGLASVVAELAVEKTGYSPKPTSPTLKQQRAAALAELLQKVDAGEVETALAIAAFIEAESACAAQFSAMKPEAETAEEIKTEEMTAKAETEIEELVSDAVTVKPDEKPISPVELKEESRPIEKLSPKEELAKAVRQTAFDIVMSRYPQEVQEYLKNNNMTLDHLKMMGLLSTRMRDGYLDPPEGSGLVKVHDDYLHGDQDGRKTKYAVYKDPKEKTLYIIIKGASPHSISHIWSTFQSLWLRGKVDIPHEDDLIALLEGVIRAHPGSNVFFAGNSYGGSASHKLGHHMERPSVGFDDLPLNPNYMRHGGEGDTRHLSIYCVNNILNQKAGSATWYTRRWHHGTTFRVDPHPEDAREMRNNPLSAGHDVARVAKALEYYRSRAVAQTTVPHRPVTEKDVAWFERRGRPYAGRLARAREALVQQQAQLAVELEAKPVMMGLSA